jgi:hypothetical protein
LQIDWVARHDHLLVSACVYHDVCVRDVGGATRGQQQSNLGRIRPVEPFKRFGVAFRGDDRGPSTSALASSRVKSWVDFDPVTGYVGKPGAKSDPSHFAGLLGFIDHTATGMPNTRISSVKTGPNSIFFRLHSAGSNPLFIMAPPIDMQVAMTANVDANRLNISASLSGDSFPNVECAHSSTGVRPHRRPCASGDGIRPAAARYWRDRVVHAMADRPLQHRPRRTLGGAASDCADGCGEQRYDA